MRGRRLFLGIVAFGLAALGVLAPPAHMLLSLAYPAYADESQKLREELERISERLKGLSAWLRRDYATAREILLPLAHQGDPPAQYLLGDMYARGRGVPEDHREAVRWWRRAAEQGQSGAQDWLGTLYDLAYMSGGDMAVLGSLPQDKAEGAKWYRRAAEQGHASAQNSLGTKYEEGEWVPRDYVEAAKWYRRAAEQGDYFGQSNLGRSYLDGRGVPQDFVLAHLWFNLAASNPLLPSEHSPYLHETAAKTRDRITFMLTPTQLAYAQRLARDWRPREEMPADVLAAPPTSVEPGYPRFPRRERGIESTGTGFLVNKGGHVLTAAHVVEDCHEVRAVTPTSSGEVTVVVASDPKNDLALLRVASKSSGVATFREGRGVRQGDEVVTIGFPLRGLLASGATLTTGTVSSLAGPRDDTRYIQITAPIQPGNSGGPLLDQSGNVIGVVAGKLDAVKIAEATGDIPQNVNFAIKAAVVRRFLDAHGVAYETASSIRKLEAADIGARARKFTAVVECWK